ncbi:phosphoserine phosphatase SerB [Sphingomonas sp. GCM10030256]|uniref:phosphoserine phosphatase SerB n=1 Tax=Sphingomonas sp. GCM10030256 TaxID=3273427 RepID=UPI00361743F6
MIIATLVAAGRLTKESLYSAADRLEDARFKAHEWSWIDEGSAADIEIQADPSKIAQLRSLLEGSIPETDVIVQPGEGREKKLLVADMDSTMIGQECIDELADYAGKKDEISSVTERAMQGDLDFATALVERVASLNGLNIGAIDRCRADRVRANPGARTLVQTMKRRGAMTLLVTGGFHDFADPMAAELGFTEVRANYLESVHGRLTGKVAGKIVDATAKCAALIEMRDRLGLSKDAVLAVGDGANDAPMITEAGLGVAYRGKPKLLAAADARLDHNDLTALLWAQGIPRREWVRD